MEEVDSVEERSRMVMTENKPLDLALGGHGPHLNSTD